MKSLIVLYRHLLADAGRKCGTTTNRDYEYILGRVEQEGNSFLTITLPTFSDDFDISLEEGRIDSNAFRSFGKHDAIPKLFSGMVSQVFDRYTGKLISNPSVEAILCIRQLCRCAKKMLLPCTKERQYASLEKYYKVEEELGTTLSRIGNEPQLYADFVHFGRRAVLSIFSNTEVRATTLPAPYSHKRDVDYSSGRNLFGLRPSGNLAELIGDLATHGPGAVVEGHSQHRKFKELSRCDWPERLAPYLQNTREWYSQQGVNLSDYGDCGSQVQFERRDMGSRSCDSVADRQPVLSTVGHLVDTVQNHRKCDSGHTVSTLTLASPLEQLTPVKVVMVPKTLKTPRVIAIEAMWTQYVQQGLMRVLVRLIEQAGGPARGHVNFSDQSLNGRLALQSSKDGKLATLDLSDASDRVLRKLVVDIFGVDSPLCEALLRTRTPTAKLPDGKIVILRKFASMGSALCFPVESLIFFIIILYARSKRAGLSVNRADFYKLARDVYVYGDDLIFPVDEVPYVVHYLQAFGLKVNSAKSFSKGNFRESCGVDAYNGVDITPVYLRRSIPQQRSALRDIVSLVSFSNQLYKKGWYETALACEEWINKMIDLPYVREDASCLGFVRTHCTKPKRWNTELQRGEILAYTLIPRKELDPIDGIDALVMWFHNSRNCDSPTFAKAEADYIKAVGRGRLTLKRRWCPV